MTDTPMPDWALLEAAKRSGWSTELGLLHQQHHDNPVYAALCDMILKHEQPPVDRKLLCARETMARNVLVREGNDYRSGMMDGGFGVQDCVRAIELWEEGFGK